MEISILEQDKHKLKLSIKGETHTFCNLIRKELWQDEHIRIAGYNIEHSLVGHPMLIVETDDKADPKKVLIKTVERLKKQKRLISIVSRGGSFLARSFALPRAPSARSSGLPHSRPGSPNGSRPRRSAGRLV